MPTHHCAGLLLGLALSLAACGSQPPSTFTSPVAPDLFAQGDQVATQLAFAQAQSTLIAGQLTATPLAATQAQQATQDTLRLTQAAFERQLTADAATLNAQLIIAAATSTAEAQRTATTVAQTQSVFATGTAEARTATPLAATEAAIVAQAERAQAEASWQKFWSGFWAALGPVLVVLFLLAVGYAFVKVLPVLKMRLGVVHDPATGRTLFLLDPGTPTNVLDPARSFGPALLSRGQAVNLGGQTEIAAQAQVTAQAQAVDLARAWPVTAPRPTLPMPVLQAQPGPTPEPPIDAQVRVIEPTAVQPWLEEMRQHLLNGDAP